MTKLYNIAVLGATGLVGSTMIQLLEGRKFPVGELYPLASKKSAGRIINFRGEEIKVADAEGFDWYKADIGLFSPGAKVSAVYAPKAVEAGCVVIDNTSQFRYEEDVPLVVPQINRDRILDYRKRGIIANPNCSTIQMLLPLKPIHDAKRIKRIIVSTYQSVSGSGQKGIDELKSQMEALYRGGELKSSVYSKPIAQNVLPEVDVYMESGYTKEEMKMLWETRKILGDDSIKVTATAARVPVIRGHSESIVIETQEKITRQEAMELMSKMDCVKIVDEPKPGGYASAATHAAGTDNVYVSRVREDQSCENGLCMWSTSDNIRVGAATNAVMIAENLIGMDSELLSYKKKKRKSL